MLDDVLKGSNVKALEDFLQDEICEETALKCSRQFVSKLDKLISRVRNITRLTIPGGLNSMSKGEGSFSLSFFCRN